MPKALMRREHLLCLEVSIPMFISRNEIAQLVTIGELELAQRLPEARLP